MKDRWNKEKERLVSMLLTDYQQGRDIDGTEGLAYPNKTEIVKITEGVRQILIPGYYGKRRKNLAEKTLDEIFESMSWQIAIALRYLEGNAERKAEDLLEEGETLTLRFLEKLPSIREVIQTDLQAAYDGDPAAFNKSEIILAYPGFFAILVNRIAHQLHLLGIPLIPRIMTEYAHEKTGIDIHPGAVLGNYFFIDHGTGIVIGETTTIGDNVKIYQGVTLGALSTREGQRLHGKKRHPTIEDNVTIYGGATILGGDTVIGRDSVIGGNAFITSSVPAGSKVSMKR